MNALYVTVSIPLLLILAGFNHAHGLTTFGKSQNNNNPVNSQPTIQAKSCTNNSGCQGINGTSCVYNNINLSKQFCLCGNNQLPDNGACSATKKGPNHMCSTDEECVKGAHCEQSKKENVKICICTMNPDFMFDCNGASIGNVISGLALVLMLACKIIY